MADNQRAMKLSPIRIAVFCLGVAALIVLAVCFTGMVVLRARVLTVVAPETVYSADGSVNSAYSDQGIFTAAGISQNEGFLLIKTSNAEKNLVEALPYIKSAKITKKFPSTVLIAPVYTKAAFAVDTVGDGARFTLLSPELKVLEREVTAVPEGCCVLKGIEFSDLTPGKDAVSADKKNKTQIAVSVYAKLMEYFAPERITMLDISSTQWIRFVFTAEHTVTVNLGDESDLDKKLTLCYDSITYTLAHGFTSDAVIDVSSVANAIFHPSDSVAEEESSRIRPLVPDEPEDDDYDYDYDAGDDGYDDYDDGYDDGDDGYDDYDDGYDDGNYDNDYDDQDYDDG